MSTSPIAVCEDPDVHEGPALLAGLGTGPSLAAHRAAVRRPRPGSPRRPRRRGRRRRPARPRRRGLPLRDQAARPRPRARGGRSSWSTSARASRRAARTVRWHAHARTWCWTARWPRRGPSAPGRCTSSSRATGRSPRAAMETAMDERRDRRVRLVRHVASPRFVAGQARAVLELMAGRPNLPVTAWTPEAVAGHRSPPDPALERRDLGARRAPAAHRSAGRARHRRRAGDDPAHAAAARVPGRRARGGVRHARWVGAAGQRRRAVLLGGFHGTWTAAAEPLGGCTVSVPGLREAGCALGAGLVLAVDDCPVVVDPADRGLPRRAERPPLRAVPATGCPALAAAVSRDRRRGRDRRGSSSSPRSSSGRGACAHPDGTVRLVRSLLAAYPDEVDRHGAGHCSWTRPARRTPAPERGLVSRALRVDWPACQARGRVPRAAARGRRPRRVGLPDRARRGHRRAGRPGPRGGADVPAPGAADRRGLDAGVARPWAPVYRAVGGGDRSGEHLLTADTCLRPASIRASGGHRPEHPARQSSPALRAAPTPRRRRTWT